MEFYTHVSIVGNSIGIRGVENGRRVTKKVQYSPTVFLPSPTPTKYKSFDDSIYLSPVSPGNIWETRNWLKEHQDVIGFKAYGNPRAEYAYLTENFPADIPYDTSLIYVANIDIEVSSENGFPNTDAAKEPILSITIERAGTYHVWGLKDYSPHIEGVNYYKCESEIHLLTSFLSFWTYDYPDVITGWHVAKFDIPYLLHRITNIMGPERAKTMSPWGKLSQKRITQFGREEIIYDLAGISMLDYMDLFKKFSRKASQESYKLGDIAFVLIGEEKLNYEEEGSLHQLYTNNFQKYIEYNIHDTTLIAKMEKKEKLLELAFTLAYQSHTNPGDVFSQVRMWTQIIDDYLQREGKFSSAFRYSDTAHDRFEGAMVKDAGSGLFNWVASFDATSLYPSLIMQHNISPDTFIEPVRYNEPMKQCMSQPINVDSLFEKKISTASLAGQNVTLTANAQLFRTDKVGFLPRIISDLFTHRQKFKKLMLATEKEVEAIKKDPHKDPEKLLQAQNAVSRYDALQNALKVCLNSSFGALGNVYFFHYDVRLAEAITLSGQLTINWAIRAANEYLNRVLKTDKDYVIAGDTDSLYLHLGPLIDVVYEGVKPSVLEGIEFMDKVCEGPLAKTLKEAFDEYAAMTHVAEKKIHFKRESLADRAIWSGGKKRYIVNVYNEEGVQFEKPKVKIKGFEMVKSSTPKICRDRMRQAVDVILTKTEEDMIQFIADFRKEFEGLPPETIAFPRGCNNLKKYFSPQTIYGLKTPIQVKGALLYNHTLKRLNLTTTYPLIQEGEKVKYLKLVMPNPIHEDVISFSNELPKEFGLHRYIDYDIMFEKSFIDPLKTILDSIGWKTKKEVSLKSLFTKPQ